MANKYNMINIIRIQSNSSLNNSNESLHTHQVAKIKILDNKISPGYRAPKLSLITVGKKPSYSHVGKVSYYLAKLDKIIL